MKKVLCLCVCICIYLSGCQSQQESKAKDNSNQMECEPCENVESLIPASMKPGTIIEFQDERSFLIKEGGYPELVRNEKITGLPKPYKGMIVTYADDGYILNIKDASDEDIAK
ncbi:MULTISPECIES: hypothetical protein [unclassified Breznakia]|uniref:hypothetical protein n=1 Tax=unclassified Breznakia TaxID=2623764 RepID=UPI002475E7D6|nr:MULTISPECIES: hypothetical protein [unclassified Breznakia]MDH6365993.1 hypothetical protein [Breznakia sp. PH1-1]MDH6403075.1 hypothetical protein [Breznakia sp. PF1-11]MDH6410784.1 hypothetical protein [Breznakia sp. PFB1-11]MDH6413159.1 hypothetical protein [Breznakia sp. PFB1-14]MDH6415527.1 hypothetical protein [Breznakia sp. PFB1-4]